MATAVDLAILHRASVQAQMDRNHWAEEVARRSRALATAQAELEAARRRFDECELLIAKAQVPSAQAAVTS